MAPIPPTAALKPGEETAGPEKDTQEGKTENDKITNSPEGAITTEVEDGASQESAEETTRKEPVARPSKCNPIPLSDIQMSMTNVILDIEKLQKSVSDYRYRML